MQGFSAVHTYHLESFLFLKKLNFYKIHPYYNFYSPPDTHFTRPNTSTSPLPQTFPFKKENFLKSNSAKHLS